MAQEVAPVPASTPAWSRPDDAVRQAQLDAMKRRATGLLALAAVVFAGASIFESTYPWLGYVRATAEASLVGGLADWFAVTALFRHRSEERRVGKECRCRWWTAHGKGRGEMVASGCMTR